MRIDTVRARYLFQRRDVRGVDAPLASATKDGVALREESAQGVWNPGDDVSGYKLVEPQDFVIGLRSFQHGLSFSGVRGLVSPAYTVLRAASGDVEPRFYAHYFRSGVLIAQLDNLSQGIRQGRTIPYDGFADLPLPRPALAEQRRIADFLDDQVSVLDRAIALRERQMLLLTEKDSADLDEAFSPWSGRAVPIASLCSRVVDCVNKTAPVASEPTQFTMIRTTNIRSGVIDLADTFSVEESTFHAWNRRGAPLRGDVLLTREAPVGQVGLLDTDRSVFLGQRIVSYRPNKARASSAFLLLALLSPAVQSQLKVRSEGSLHAHLRVGECLKVQIPAVPIEHQPAIVGALTRARQSTSQAAQLGQCHAHLIKERKQALITAAVTGQFDVTTARSVA